jgi:hypothetical protein
MRSYVLRRALLPVVTGAVVAALVVIGAPAASADQQRVYVAEMSGDQTVPDPGDPDGTGTAVITTDSKAGTLCAMIHTENVTEDEPYNPIFGIVLFNVGSDPLPGHPGAVAMVLSAAETTNPDFEGCRSASSDLIKEIRRFPHRFYVQVNTFAFTGGAIRGQLTEVAKN